MIALNHTIRVMIFCGPNWYYTFFLYIFYFYEIHLLKFIMGIG